MTPATERPAAELDSQLNTTGGGRTQDPAARRAPVTRRGLPSPAAAPVVAGEGPSSSRPAGSPFHLPGGTARTWTIEMPAGLPLLSLNGREHWAARNRKTQALKDAAIVMARQAKIPPLERVSITAEYQPPDRRQRDPDNIAASVKAAIDGCRIAKVMPQDDSRYVTEVTCRIGPVYPKGRLVLHLTEVAP